MRRAGYSPLQSNKTGSTGMGKPQAGETIGMVGYFPPLVEKLLAQKINIRVLEINPERVEDLSGVKLCTKPAELVDCEHVLCTSSTLINGTLPGLLEVCRQSRSFSLLGPSGSGLPDLWFERGVDSVGGIVFHDLPALHESLDTQQSWGQTGHKYQIRPVDYPGVRALLDAIRQKEHKND